MQKSGSVVVDMAVEVQRFMDEVLGIPIPLEPTRLSGARKRWALSAFREEVKEFEEADNIDDEADALIDLTYFALGRLIEMGIAPRPVFEEVHAANMRKRRGFLSKRPDSLGYDAVKPEGWKGPDLHQLLTLGLDQARHLLAIRGMYDWNDLPGEAVDAATLSDVTVTGASIGGQAATPEILIGGLVRADKLNVDQLSTLGSLGEAVLPRSKPKVLVIGYARHGKDTVCEMLRDLYGLRFTASSLFLAEKVVLPAMVKANAEWLSASHTDPAQKSREAPFPRYATADECFEDRGNHRAFWFDTIAAYCSEDPSRLAKEIFERHDVYAGVRSKREFNGIKNRGLFDLCVWVDRSDHLPPEPTSSCTVAPWMADCILDNNGTLDDLRRELQALMQEQFGYPAS